MSEKKIPLSEFESVALMGLALAGNPLPMAFGPGGVSLIVDEDGAGQWAVEKLAEIRRNSGLFIVTVKLPRNPDHNPRAKKTGPCPVSGEHCTDVTGEHHSVLLRTTDLSVDLAGFARVTRVERVGS